MTEQLTGLRQLRLENQNHCKSLFFFFFVDRSCANSAAINKGRGGKKRGKTKEREQCIPGRTVNHAV